MKYTDAIKYLREHHIYKDEETKEFYEFGDVCHAFIDFLRLE